MLLKDRKVIVTGGPTREWLDPVRFLSNPSSGKMGVALADQVFARCRKTVLIHGPVAASTIAGKKYGLVPVESTADLLDAVLDELEDNAVLIMAAAPADYTPVEKSEIKIKKNDGEVLLRLKRTPDVLKEVARIRESGLRTGMFVVGFAAETTDTERYARSKLEDKKLDMICLNDVSASGAGFAIDTNIMTLFTRRGGRFVLPLMAKGETASRIIDIISGELAG